MRKRIALYNIKVFAVLIAITTLLNACNTKNDNKKPDDYWYGSINVSADESFKPIVDELAKVYESNRPKTKINVTYKPEAECFKDFYVDSVRMIIATRPYTSEEREIMVDSFSVSPNYMAVARDAIAVIVNPSSPDSVFTMPELKAILTGKFSKKLIPVFDGVKATSTVRFIIDSVLRGDTLTKDAVAARSSNGVLDYIAKTPNAIGFVGVSWIGNKEDPEQVSYLKEVKIARLESKYMPGHFVKPYQDDIYTKNYPLVRDLVYILKENYKGLGYGFAGFMSSEIGQLIFRRAYLAPLIIKNFGIREANVKE